METSCHRSLTSLLCCGLLTTAHAQTNYQRLKSFGYPELSGELPSALVEGKDGRLYGTTSADGEYHAGTVFRLNKDGGGYVALHHFMGGPEDGERPTILAAGNDGALYGITDHGGAKVVGIVFSLSADGGAYTVLHHFTTIEGYHGRPSGLVIGKDGALFGTTDWDGATDSGKIFKMNRDGSGFTVLRRFGPNSADGAYPSSLVAGPDGARFGTLHRDYERIGAVFKLDPD